MRSIARSGAKTDVALIVDAGPLYAQADSHDPGHRSASMVLRRERGLLVTTELVIAEVAHLILSRLGAAAELAFASDLAGATYRVECLTTDEWRAARALLVRYPDLRLGLADASLVVLAQRFGTRRILTFDERAFRVVQPLQGGTFTVLPADDLEERTGRRGRS